MKSKEFERRVEYIIAHTNYTRKQIEEMSIGELIQLMNRVIQSDKRRNEKC
jgi:hypothetical protein